MEKEVLHRSAEIVAELLADLDRKVKLFMWL